MVFYKADSHEMEKSCKKLTLKTNYVFECVSVCALRGCQQHVCMLQVKTALRFAVLEAVKSEAQ